MKWLRENVGWVIVTLLSAVVGAGITIYYNYSQNQLQYLDYYTYPSESILEKVNEIGGEIDIQVDGNKIDNLSALDIYFVNNTNTDFVDVPIYIDIFYKGSDSLKIISINTYGQNNSKELVKILKTEKSEYKNGLRLGYEFGVVNRDIQNPVASIRLLIEGKTIPDYKIEINKKGLEARKKELIDPDLKPMTYQYFLTTISLCLMFMLTFLLYKVNRHSISTKSTK